MLIRQVATHDGIGIFAALYILIASDGKPIDKWGYGIAPAVYLAIISVVTNVLLSFALVNGLVISFWRTALQGSTVSKTITTLNISVILTNSSWKKLTGTGVPEVRRGVPWTTGFRKGGRITALGMVEESIEIKTATNSHPKACLFTIVGLLRGPLNQRASLVRPNDPFTTQGSMKLNVAQTLPDGYTGLSVQSRAKVKSTARLTQVFGSVMQGYSSRSDMKLDHTVCGDSCTTNVKVDSPQAKISYQVTLLNVFL